MSRLQGLASPGFVLPNYACRDANTAQMRVFAVHIRPLVIYYILTWLSPH